MDKKFEPIVVSLKAKELMESQQALQNLDSLEVDAKTAYWLGKTLKKVRAQFEHIAKDLTVQRNALIKEVGEEVFQPEMTMEQVIVKVKDAMNYITASDMKEPVIETLQHLIAALEERKPTGTFRTNEACKEEFDKRWDEIMEKTVSIEVTPISIEAMGDAKIHPADVGALEWLLVD